MSFVRLSLVKMEEIYSDLVIQRSMIEYEGWMKLLLKGEGL